MISTEHYRCTELKQLQSSYFQKTELEVSINVTIIHRHALLDIVGVENSEENTEIVTEHFFVVSVDQQHDQYFVHAVLTLVIGIETLVMVTWISGYG